MLHSRCLLLHHVTMIRVWKDTKLSSPYQLKVKTLSVKEHVQTSSLKAVF